MINVVCLYKNCPTTSASLAKVVCKRTDMRTALFWAITNRAVVIPYRRFGTTYPSHLQGSRIRFILTSVFNRGTPVILNTIMIFLCFADRASQYNLSN